jgi:hypothetical protein
MTVIREPVVAGQFCPGNASESSATICGVFDEAQVKPVLSPKALIEPPCRLYLFRPVAMQGVYRQAC